MSACAGPAITPADVPPELPLFGSDVALSAVAVFEIGPLVAATSTTSVNVALAPFACDAAVHVIVPVAPTAGVTQTKPAGVVMERKSSDAGSTSSISTLVAASGPLFVTTIVYENVLPAGALVVAVVLVML